MKTDSKVLLLGGMAFCFIAVAGVLSSGTGQVREEPQDPLIEDIGFTPSGWVGDFGDVSFTDAWTTDPHSPPACIQIRYSALGSQKQNNAAIYWLRPSSNWGPRGTPLDQYRRVTFYARGERGGEQAEFRVGGVPGDSIQPEATSGVLVLGAEWQQYFIDLSKKENKSNVVAGFAWITDKSQNPNGCTIYLDDIAYE